MFGHFITVTIVQTIVLCQLTQFCYHYHYLFLFLSDLSLSDCVYHSPFPSTFSLPLSPQALFKPLNVPRNIFSKLVHDEYAVVLSMYPGEPYANEQISKTDRLGLLINGR